MNKKVSTAQFTWCILKKVCWSTHIFHTYLAASASSNTNCTLQYNMGIRERKWETIEDEREKSAHLDFHLVKYNLHTAIKHRKLWSLNAYRLSEVMGKNTIFDVNTTCIQSSGTRYRRTSCGWRGWWCPATGRSGATDRCPSGHRSLGTVEGVRLCPWQNHPIIPTSCLLLKVIFTFIL